MKKTWEKKNKNKKTSREVAQRYKKIVTEAKSAQHQETADVEQDWQNMEKRPNQIGNLILKKSVENKRRQLFGYES